MVEVAYQNQAGEWLFAKQRNEPFRGLIGFPCGRLHEGERLEEAAKREFYEQTGLEAIELAYYGSFAMELQLVGTVASHLITHLFKALAVKGDLRKENPVSTPFYSNKVTDNAFPELAHVIERVKGKPLSSEYSSDLVFKLS